MSSKKVLIMPSQPHPSPDNRTRENEGSPLAPGPITPSDVRTLFTAVDIYKTIGRLEHAVETLESAKDSFGEKQAQIVQKVDKVEYILSNLQRANVSQGERLGHLEKEFYAGKVLGGIIVAGGILLALAIYLVQRLTPFFPK